MARRNGSLLNTMSRRIKSGLVAYWPLDEATGATRRTAFGHALGDMADHATVVGSASGGPSVNIPNYAGFTNVSNQYLSMDTNNFKFPTSGRFGWCGWNYNETLPGGGNFWGLMSKDAAGKRTVQVLVDPTGVLNCQMLNGSSGTGNPTTGVLQTTGTWYFVAAWCDGGRIYISQNAGTPTSAVLTVPYSVGDDLTQTFDLGADRNSATRYLDGRLSHHGLWNRPFAPGELTWLYNNGQGRDLRRGC